MSKGLLLLSVIFEPVFLTEYGVKNDPILVGAYLTVTFGVNF